jgi:hypothetical protein
VSELQRLDARTDGQDVERTRYLVRGTIAPRFVDARAMCAADAIPFAPATPRERRALAAMIADGSIRVAAPGRFYFDMAAYEAAAAARARRLTAAVDRRRARHRGDRAVLLPALTAAARGRRASSVDAARLFPQAASLNCRLASRA